MVQQSNIDQVQIDLSRDLQVYYKLPFYAFNSPIGKKKKKRQNSLHLVEIPPRFLQRNSNTRHSESLLWLKVHELHDHNATIPQEFAEPNSTLNQKWTQAESSDRTDKCFLPQHQMCTFHIMGIYPVAQPESPLQGIRLISLIADYPYIISQGLN